MTARRATELELGSVGLLEFSGVPPTVYGRRDLGAQRAKRSGGSDHLLECLER